MFAKRHENISGFRYEVVARSKVDKSKYEDHLPKKYYMFIPTTSLIFCEIQNISGNFSNILLSCTGIK